MSVSQSSTCDDAGLPDLFQVAVRQWRLIAGCAFAFLVAAIIGTVVRQPTYEATAYLEAADESDIATIQDRLRFPSLYQRIYEDPGAAQALANRVRVGAGRDSRIIGVTVSHNEPAIAAEEANAMADAFVGVQLEERAKLDELRKQLRKIPALSTADATIVERATIPLQPAGVPPVLIWLGALALGGFAGFLLALCRAA